MWTPPKPPDDLISQMLGTSQKSANELPPHIVNCPAEQMELKTALKEFCAQCLKAGISMQPLIRPLLNIYANVQVVKGQTAMLCDKVWKTPILLERRQLILQAQMIHEDVWILDATVTNFLEALETKSTEPATS